MSIFRRGIGITALAMLLGIALGLAVAACGGGGEEKPAATATPAAGGTPATPVAGMPASGSLAVEVGERGGQNYMSPTRITARAGQEFTITMKNVGAAVHNIHIFTKKGGDSIAATDPLAVPPGKEGVLKAKIDRPGTYFVQCDFHPEVQGEVIVQ